MTAYAPLYVVVGFALGLGCALVLVMLFRATGSDTEPAQVAIEVKALVLTLRFWMTFRGKRSDQPSEFSASGRELSKPHDVPETVVSTGKAKATGQANSTPTI
jgi:hypothetical protein